MDRYKFCASIRDQRPIYSYGAYCGRLYTPTRSIYWKFSVMLWLDPIALPLFKEIIPKNGSSQSNLLYRDVQNGRTHMYSEMTVCRISTMGKERTISVGTLPTRTHHSAHVYAVIYASHQKLQIYYIIYGHGMKLHGILLCRVWVLAMYSNMEAPRPDDYQGV